MLLTYIDTQCPAQSTLSMLHGKPDEPHRTATSSRPSLPLAIATTPAACCAPLTAATLANEEAQTTAALFRALADPQRVRIINLLANSPEAICVCAFTAVLGISQPSTSHHLKKLVQAGLLDREQRDVWAYFTLNRDGIQPLAAVADPQGGTP